MAKKKKVSGFVLGALMVLGGISGLFWNEWRSAHRIATLLEGQDQAVSAAGGKVAQNHDGKLVHVAGDPRLEGMAVDPVFGVARDALLLERSVEMFQWRERKEGSGDERRVVHEKVWADGRINSESFEEPMGRVNPPFPNLSSENFYPPKVLIGDYQLTGEILDRIRRLNDVSPPQGQMAPVEGLKLKAEGGFLTTGSIAAPEIGDVRIGWREAPPVTYSVLAGQSGTELVTWKASNNGEIAMIETGALDMATMFDQAFSENSRMTWLARGGFTLAIFGGFTVLLRRLARAIPLLGAVAAKLAKPLALILTAVTALLTIAAGWLFFRPVFSLGLIAAAIAAALGIRWMRSSKPDDDLAHVSDTPPPPPPAAPPPAPAG